MTKQDYEARQASLMHTTPLVVAFAGYAGSGKNTAAGALLLHDGSGRKWVGMGVADAIKDALLAVNPVVTDMARYVSHPWCATSTIRLLDAVAEHGWDVVHRWPEVRRMMEALGAWGRGVDEEMWIGLLVNRVSRALEDGYSVAITDLRHEFEAHRLFYFFDVPMIHILVQRPSVGPVSDDERAATQWFDEWDFDAILSNDGDVAALHRQVFDVLAAYGVHDSRTAVAQ